MLQRPRKIQVQTSFFPLLVQAIVVPPWGGIPGSVSQPSQFQRGAPTAANFQKSYVFWTPIADKDRGITAAAFQGSSVRPLSFQHGTEGWLNYQRPSFFWSPIEDKDRGITGAAWQGSSVRPLQFQHGTEGWQNVQRPSVFRTPIEDRDRGVTPAAWQGSNVRPNPVPWRLNYLDPAWFAQIEPIKFQFPIETMVITYLFHPVGLTFAVSCNYQSEVPLVSAFTPDTPLPDAFTGENPLVVSWASDSPYCKPGQT